MASVAQRRVVAEESEELEGRVVVARAAQVIRRARAALAALEALLKQAKEGQYRSQTLFSPHVLLRAVLEVRQLPADPVLAAQKAEQTKLADTVASVAVADTVAVLKVQAAGAESLAAAAAAMGAATVAAH